MDINYRAVAVGEWNIDDVSDPESQNQPKSNINDDGDCTTLIAKTKSESSVDGIKQLNAETNFRSENSKISYQVRLERVSTENSKSAEESEDLTEKIKSKHFSISQFSSSNSSRDGSLQQFLCCSKSRNSLLSEGTFKTSNQEENRDEHLPQSGCNISQTAGQSAEEIIIYITHSNICGMFCRILF